MAVICVADRLKERKVCWGFENGGSRILGVFYCTGIQCRVCRILVLFYPRGNEMLRFQEFGLILPQWNFMLKFQGFGVSFYPSGIQCWGSRDLGFILFPCGIPGWGFRDFEFILFHWNSVLRFHDFGFIFSQWNSVLGFPEEFAAEVPGLWLYFIPLEFCAEIPGFWVNFIPVEFHADCSPGLYQVVGMSGRPSWYFTPTVFSNHPKTGKTKFQCSIAAPWALTWELHPIVQQPGNLGLGFAAPGVAGEFDASFCILGHFQHWMGRSSCRRKV